MNKYSNVTNAVLIGSQCKIIVGVKFREIDFSLDKLFVSYKTPEMAVNMFYQKFILFIGIFDVSTSVSDLFC